MILYFPDIYEAHKNSQICSLTGVEGGHSLGGSLGILRTFYTLGVRYVTLTSTCNTPWADSSNADAPHFDVKNGGLTSFGKVSNIYFLSNIRNSKRIVMNRIIISDNNTRDESHWNDGRFVARKL